MEILASGLRPRVIALDLSMPRMDGWAFVRHLRGAAHSSVLVLLTSPAAREPTPTQRCRRAS